MLLVGERGRLMQGVQALRPGAMAAVRGVDAEQLEQLCRAASAGAGDVRIANLNSPRQTVVSGDAAAVGRLLELVPSGGDARATRLRVGAAFHSDLMRPVQAELRKTLDTVRFQDVAVPLVANWSGRAIREAEAVRDALVRQIASPVRWMECVRTLVDAGCRTLVELGPGKVLSSITSDIDASVESVPAKAPAQLTELLASGALAS